jgi:hypothetical protein
MPADLTRAGLRDFVLSFSAGSGAVMVAVLSGLLTWVFSKLWRGHAVWVLPFTVPLVVSYSFYWLPFWMGADDLEASTWAGLFIIAWYLAGAEASVFSVVLLRSLRK